MRFAPNFGKMLKDGIGGLPFGIGYSTGTRVGYEKIFPAIFGSSSNKPKYYGRPSYFKLPYYRFRSSRYGRRYGRRYRKRYGFGRKRIFRSYRARRYY